MPYKAIKEEGDIQPRFKLLKGNLLKNSAEKIMYFSIRDAGKNKITAKVGRKKLKTKAPKTTDINIGTIQRTAKFAGKETKEKVEKL